MTIDGNEAVAHIAYRLNEVIAIYPITPSSPMGEWVDTWATAHKPNLWGTVPSVIEMQSEGGTAQNPDVYFQARETVNPFYDDCLQITQTAIDQFAQLTGEQYRLFEYHGAADTIRSTNYAPAGLRRH